ncbi:MAG: peptidoglycan recognition family protein [Nanoarchaeota archaeon]|nr:peptidoglycan recognition family protein [Nanoarchaeota archaeon]
MVVNLLKRMVLEPLERLTDLGGNLPETSLDRRGFFGASAGLAAMLVSLPDSSYGAIGDPRIIKRPSPRINEREIVHDKKYIWMHNTETPSNNQRSIDAVTNKLIRSGEAHYVIQPDGTIIDVLGPNREGFNIGKGIWNNRTDLDAIGIGIEFVGMHYNLLTSEQYDSGRWLINHLQDRFNIGDDAVLPHSAVACTNYKNASGEIFLTARGRKEGCGALFAIPEVRRRIGIGPMPEYDPDVEAGRVVVKVNGNGEYPQLLYKLLYGTQDDRREALHDMIPWIRKQKMVWIGGKRKVRKIPKFVVGNGQTPITMLLDRNYKRESIDYAYPDGTNRRWSEIGNYKSIPTGTIVRDTLHESLNAFLFPEILRGEGKGYRTFEELIKSSPLDLICALEEKAGKYAKSPHTAYTSSHGSIRGDEKGLDLALLPEDTKVIFGQSKSAASIIKEIGVHGDTVRECIECGFTDKTTHYFFPDGKVYSGNQMTESALEDLPVGTRILTGYRFAGYLNPLTINGEGIEKKVSEKDKARLEYPSTVLFQKEGYMITGEGIKIEEREVDVTRVSSVGPDSTKVETIGEETITTYNLPNDTRAYIKVPDRIDVKQDTILKVVSKPL